MNALSNIPEARLLQGEWTERMGWTLLHSLWQIALLAGVYAALMLLLQRRSAATRYVVGCLTLSAMLGLSVSTYVLLPHDTARPTTAHVANAPAVANLLVDSTERSAPDNHLAESNALAVEQAAMALDSTARESDKVPAGGGTLPFDILPALRSYLPLATATWLAGVLLFSLRPVWGWLYVRRLQRRGLSPLSETLQSAGERIRRCLGVNRAVRFARSSLVEVPAVVGYLRPLVLLPASVTTGLSSSEIEMILAHELAHVRRHDYLVNVVQTVIEALLFYHPGMWWVSSQIRRERENCCDDVAVSVCGSRASYVRTLARLAEQRLLTPATVLGATGSPLVARARRLLGQPPAAIGYRHATAWLAGLVTIGLVAAALAMNGASAEIVAGSPDGGRQAAGSAPPVERVQPNGRTASLTGRFIYDGEPPAPKSLEISPYRYMHDGTRVLDAMRQRWSKVEIPDERLIVRKDGGIANVLVWVRSKDIPKPVVPAQTLRPATIQAKDGRFQPHVLAFWNAAPMRLINEMTHGVNFNWSPSKGHAHNVSRKQADPPYEFKVDAQILPIGLTCNIQPWMQSYILPLDHPYFAVSGPDGRFKMTGLPPGTWEFRFWHEQVGWLATDRFASRAGRFSLKLRPGENALGDLLVNPDALVKRTSPADARAARRQPADFFPRDPYPGLGHVRNAGPGWHFLRVAGDRKAAEDLGISTEQQEAIKLLFDAYLGKDRELEARVRKEHGRLPPEVWEPGRQEQWLRARELARRLLTDSQVRRVEKMMVMRQAFHPLLKQDVQRILELSGEQIAEITAAIGRHGLRTGNGRDSLRLLGSEVSLILTPEQRTRFDQLRGLSRDDAPDVRQPPGNAASAQPQPAGPTADKQGPDESIDRFARDPSIAEIGEALGSDLVGQPGTVKDGVAPVTRPDIADGEKVPAEAAPSELTMMVTLEDGAGDPLEFVLLDAYSQPVKTWENVAPGDVRLELPQLEPDRYSLKVSASGYGVVRVALTVPRQGIQVNVKRLELYRRRYAVLRYAVNTQGTRTLAGPHVKEGRVAISFGRVPDLYGDWLIDQAKASPVFRFHRYGANGFAQPHAETSFQDINIAPHPDQYTAKTVIATKGMILLNRIQGNGPRDRCYAKILVEDVTESPPKDIQVIDTLLPPTIRKVPPAAKIDDSPSDRSSGEFTATVRLEDNARTPVTLELRDGVRNTLKVWDKQQPGEIRVRLPELERDRYTLVARAEGHAPANTPIKISDAGLNPTEATIELRRLRYLILRYVINTKGHRKLTGADVKAGRVAILFGHVPELRDWSVGQSDGQLKVVYHRVSPNTGFAPAAAGPSFDELEMAPPAEDYSSGEITFEKGMVLFNRVRGRRPQHARYAKFVVEDITETRPANLQIIDSRPR